jgi:hypothetical protein
VNRWSVYPLQLKALHAVLLFVAGVSRSPTINGRMMGLR